MRRIGQEFGDSVRYTGGGVVGQHQQVLSGEPGLEGGRGALRINEPLQEVTDGGRVVGCEDEPSVRHFLQRLVGPPSEDGKGEGEDIPRGIEPPGL